MGTENKFQRNAITAVLKASLSHIFIFSLADLAVAITFLIENFQKEGDIFYWITFLTFNIISILTIAVIFSPFFVFKYFLKYRLSVNLLEKKYAFYTLSFLFLLFQIFLIHYGIDLALNIDKELFLKKTNVEEIILLSTGYLFGYLFALKKFVEEIQKDEASSINEKEYQYILSSINNKKYF